jgi:predicted DCC family thiol-disulfide oxidoreductase YuxK
VYQPGRLVVPAPPRLWHWVRSLPLWSFLARAYGLDLRSLALFRVAIGALVIGDLISRARDLRAFYTDFGVLPRAVLLGALQNQWNISLHLTSGEAIVQAFLFVVAMVFGVMLLVGYRTRLATIVSLVLLLSLQNRNPLVLDAGDIILRMLLFWGMFLPLNAHFSLDRALDDSGTRPPERVFSAGSVALMAQTVFLYWFAVIWKSAPDWWTAGSAMYYALSIEQYATPVGRLLLHFPELLKFLTFFTMAIEMWAPALLLCPFLTGPMRTASVLSVFMLHLGILTCMHLGRFPLVSMTAVVGFIPTGFWALAARRRDRGAATSPLRIYYDAGCGFCRKTVRILMTFIAPRGAVVLPAQSDPQALATMMHEESWTVVDPEGVRHVRSSALACLARHSMWKPLAWLLDAPPFKKPADAAYAWVARQRPLLGRLTEWMRYRPLQLRTHWLASVLAAFFLGYVFWWNLATVSSRVTIPAGYRWIGVATGTAQSWGMFAPHPMRYDGWYVIPGVLRSGRRVDLIRRGAPVSFATPSSAAVAGQYPDERWRNYLMHVYYMPSEYRLPYMTYYGRYLCRNWNEGRAPGDPDRLTKLDIYFMVHSNVLWTQAPNPYHKELLLQNDCQQ